MATFIICLVSSRSASRIGTSFQDKHDCAQSSKYTHPPKEPATEMDIVNKSQVSQLLIAGNGHRLEVLFHLALVTGARQMELLGLKWSDLD